MELSFIEISNISENATQVNLGHETNNELYEYYLKDRQLYARKTKPKLSNYFNTLFKRADNPISTRVIDRFGVKTFPHMGTYCWYHSVFDNRTYILCPLHAKRTVNEAPTFLMNKQYPNVTFTISDPATQVYMCYRIFMNSGDFTVEYVTYEKTVTLPLPDPGSYIVTVRGQVDSSLVSELAETQVLDVYL